MAQSDASKTSVSLFGNCQIMLTSYGWSALIEVKNTKMLGVSGSAKR